MISGFGLGTLHGSRAAQERSAYGFRFAVTISGTRCEKEPGPYGELASVLRACCKFVDLKEGRIIHHHVIKCNYEEDQLLANLVMQMYGRCGALSDAYFLFSQMHYRDVFSWTFIMSAYSHARRENEALLVFQRMQHESIDPSAITFVEILRIYGKGFSMVEGKRVHACISARSDIILLNALVNYYGKSGNMEAAKHIFHEIKERDVVSWNTMLTACKEHDEISSVIQYFQRMVQECVIPNKVTISFAVYASACKCNLMESKRIHAYVVGSWLSSDVSINNMLICMYSKCSTLSNSIIVFHEMHEHNVISWTSLITAFTHQGLGGGAIALMQRMQQEAELPNNVTFLNVISACTKDLLGNGKCIHAQIQGTFYAMDTGVGNSLIHMYGRCGCVNDAMKAFDQMPIKDRVSWNSIILAYAEQGHATEALELFQGMYESGVCPDRATFVTVLEVCTNKSAINEGKRLHYYIKNSDLELDSIMGTALVNFYGKCGSLESAKDVFENVTVSTVILWTAMTSAYIQHNEHDRAVQIFHQMKQQAIIPDRLAFSVILSACYGLKCLRAGKQFHACIRGLFGSEDTTIGNALVSMYGNCGMLDKAENEFHQLVDRTVVSWTAMMAACIQSGQPKQAFHFYEKMLSDGILPNKLTFATLIEACISLTALAEGNYFYNLLLVSGVDPDIVLTTALVNLYSRCGCLRDAQRVFDRMSKRNIVAWNSIIAGYCRHGEVNQVRKLFQQMQTESVRPDEVTLLSIISSFSHAGLVDEAHSVLLSMVCNYGLRPTTEHFNCMIDLLGRAGCLDEVEEVVSKSPFGTTFHSLMSFLNACKLHMDVGRGEGLINGLSKSNHGTNVAARVLMSNIYAAAGQFQSASSVRKVP